MSRMIKYLVCVFLAGAAQAQMAHEVLLLVNKNSQPSLRVANVFVEARQIPKINIVYLDIPESAYGGAATVTPEEFTRLIWEPANAMAKERGIEGRILAWVYSVDFPIRVKTDSYDRKQMSVGGLTFMRNQIPGLSLVEDGKYLSKLFGGPNGRLKASLMSLWAAPLRSLQDFVTRHQSSKLWKRRPVVASSSFIPPKTSMFCSTRRSPRCHVGWSNPKKPRAAPGSLPGPSQAS